MPSRIARCQRLQPRPVTGRRPHTAGTSAIPRRHGGSPPSGPAIAALADARSLPAENLLAPDAVRRLSWQPPEPVSPQTVGTELERYGARPWQVEITAMPIASALLGLGEQDEA